MRLADELKLFKLTIDEDAFRDLLVDIFHAFCPSWSVEHLLYHWWDAGLYCEQVRIALRRDENSELDAFILRVLNNIRKRGEGEVS